MNKKEPESADEHLFIGIGGVNGQRTDRTEELCDAPERGNQHRAFSHRRRRRAKRFDVNDDVGKFGHEVRIQDLNERPTRRSTVM